MPVIPLSHLCDSSAALCGSTTIFGGGRLRLFCRNHGRFDFDCGQYGSFTLYLGLRFPAVLCSCRTWENRCLNRISVKVVGLRAVFDRLIQQKLSDVDYQNRSVSPHQQTANFGRWDKHGCLIVQLDRCCVCVCVSAVTWSRRSSTNERTVDTVVSPSLAARVCFSACACLVAAGRSARARR